MDLWAVFQAMVSCANLVKFYLESVSVSYRDSFEYGLHPGCLLDLDLNLDSAPWFFDQKLEKHAFENINKEENSPK